MAAVISFAAWSHTGKTTYLEKLIPVLKRAGLRVAVIKHDAHDFQIDVRGKDSWRLMEAGADTVALASGARFALLERWPLDLEDIVRRLPEADLILTEGYKHGPYPKVALFRAGAEKPLAVEPRECLAIVSDTPVEAECPVFPLDDPQPLADYLLAHLPEERRTGDAHLD